MKKIPKSWAEVSRNPEWIEYEAPCGPSMSARLDRAFDRTKSENTICYIGNGPRCFFRGGRWWARRKVRNPSYVEPDQIIVIYGLDIPEGGCVLCRVPPGLPWRRILVPALNKVARQYGKSFTARNENDRCYLEGCEVETFEKTKTLKRYQWDGNQFQELPKASASSG